MVELITPPRRAAAPLLNAEPGTLTLRVCGGSHHGRLITIRSPKCTIGSAAGCTLRLRAAGVRPLHCWILRGRAGTVVRRCSGGTLLNGQAYEDAPLKDGDRLRIGTVELEVVECQSSGPKSPRSSPTNLQASSAPVSRANTQELEALLADANDEIARLETDARQAWQTSVTASERAEQLRTALEQANVELGEMRGELETAQAALLREREETEPRLAAMRQQLEQAQRKLSASEATMVQAQRQIEEQSSRSSQERETFQRQIGQLQREIERAQSQARQASQMTIPIEPAPREEREVVSRDWEAKISQLEADVARLQSELDAACKQRDDARQWETRCRQADQQLEHWQAEAHRQQLAAEELQAQLASATAELTQAHNSAQGRLEAEQRELADLRAALEQRAQQLDLAERQLTEQQTQIAREKESLEAEHHAQQAALNDKEALLNRQAESLQDQLDELAVQQTELEEAREQLARASADCDARQAQLAAIEAELTAGRAEIEASRQSLAAPQPPNEEQPEEGAGRFCTEPLGQIAVEVASQLPPSDDIAAQAAVAATTDEDSANPHDSNVDSVLSRLVRAGLWRDDASGSSEHQAEGSPASEPVQPAPSNSLEVGQSCTEEAAVEQPAAPEPVLSAQGFEHPPQKREAADHDEESIESYMERLLQRVRGDSSDAPRPAIAVPASQAPAPARIEAKEEAAAPIKPPVATVKPEEFVPRSQAPEMNSNMAAMRELANSAARSAIAKHDRKTTGKHVTGRLIGATAVFGTSALLAYLSWRQSSIAAAVGSAVGVTASIYWSVLAVGHMLHSVRLGRPQEAVAAPASPAEPPVADVPQR